MKNPKGRRRGTRAALLRSHYLEIVVAIVVGMMLLGPRGIAAAGPESVARLWRRSRGDNPGERLASLVADQLCWARFHLGDDSAPGGAFMLPAKVQQRIRQPTVTLRTSTLGDAIGFGWFLRWADRPRPDLAGTALVSPIAGPRGQPAASPPSGVQTGQMTTPFDYDRNPDPETEQLVADLLRHPGA